MPIFRREGKMPPEERRFWEKRFGWMYGCVDPNEASNSFRARPFHSRDAPEKMPSGGVNPTYFQWCENKNEAPQWELFSNKLTFDFFSDRRFFFLAPLQWKRTFWRCVGCFEKMVVSITSLAQRAFTSQAPHLRTMAKTWGSVSAKNGGYPHKSTSTAEDVCIATRLGQQQ